MKKTTILITFLLFLSCKKEYYDNLELFNSEFESYLNTFLEEANKRGYNYNIQNIDFYFADIKNQNVGGLCEKDGKIVIDRFKWVNGSESYKEWIVFHELGHCLLNRNHRNESTKSGECISIMKGQENGFNCSSNLYSKLWRDYFLDELFDEKTELPEWHSNNQEYNYNYNNKQNIVTITNLSTEFYNSTLEFNNTENFVIEFNFKDWRNASGGLNTVISDIYFGGYFFGSSPFSTSEKIYITGESIGSFFISNNYEFNTNIKFTLRKNSKLMQFFIDEQFIHAMEIEFFINNVIKASFNTKINMDIAIFKYN